MAKYENLKSRMDNGEVIVLDGAIGTELQAMGVPMDPASWCGPGNHTHPATVRQMHERYIRAGADIITTNTFNTLRPALEASGYGEMVREINTRAVDAALEARDRAAGDRPVYIAWLHLVPNPLFATAGPGRFWAALATVMEPASRRMS